MNYTEITSRSNDKIKYVGKLTSSASERRQSSLFVLEGARLCYDALRSGYKVRELYFTKEAQERFCDIVSQLIENAGASYMITEEVKKKLSDTVSSQGVFCVVEMKEQSADKIDFKGKYIALESVQNPQNLGSVARTAEALGIDGLIVCGGCDIYNPKALRASMGSLLRIPVIITDELTVITDDANKNGMLTVATVPDGNADDITQLDFSSGVIAVIGNEGNGVSEELKSSVKCKATIKMKGAAESLNASAAAVITMWEIMR